MFDRFTDRARKVMGYSRQEAERFLNDFIGTEHILLGILKEGVGVACQAMHALGIDLIEARAVTEQHVRRGSAESMAQLPFSSDARRVLDEAVASANATSSRYVGTEHLLIGLYAIPDCTAARALAEFGPDEPAVRAVVQTLEIYDSEFLPTIVRAPDERVTSMAAGMRLVSRSAPQLLQAFERVMSDAEESGEITIGDLRRAMDDVEGGTLDV